MTYTTPNGIRYPNDPSAYADIVKFFKEMAEDIDTRFVPTTGANLMTGTSTAKNFSATNGGLTQASAVLQTGAGAGAFTIYDDNVKVDGSTGRRLWVNGPNGGDVAIRTRSGSENLNRISMRATTLDLNGAVTINGTLNVTGMQTQHVPYEADYDLPANVNTWTAFDARVAGFTFIAPPSERVTIGYGGLLPVKDGNVALSYRVGTGASINGGTVVLPQVPSGWTTQPGPQSISQNGTGTTNVQWASTYTAFQLGPSITGYQPVGLKAGQTYNVKPYYRNQNTVISRVYRQYFVVTPDL